MKNLILLASLAGVVVCADVTMAQSFNRRTNSATTAPTDDSDPLATKSIFSRTRTARVATQPAQPTYTPPPPQRLPVLVGIVRQDDGILAIFEHPTSGTISQARLGDAAPGGAGTVMAMTLDHIEILPAADLPPMSVMIGQDVRGSTAEPIAPSTTNTTATVTTGGEPALDDGDDVLSRMRRRRQQETNR